MKIEAITVDLDEYQVGDIAPLLKKVHDAATEGKPGMLLAQVFGDTMKVFFATIEQALEMQRIMGSPVGKTSGGTCP